MVKARNVALVISGVNNIGIIRIRCDVACFPAAHRIPEVAPDDAVIAAAGDCDRGIILLRTTRSERRPRIGGDVVKLRGRLVIFPRPRLAAIETRGASDFARCSHSFGMSWINPKTVVIAVW